MSEANRELLEKRIGWLEQKLREMRRVGGPEYNPSKQQWGRVEGEISGLRWALNTIRG